MVLALLACACMGLLCILLSLYTYARWNYGRLEALGIPVITPHHWLGSLPDLHLRVQQLEDVKRFREFGPVFGLYEGRSPQIHICDPELVRLILVKDQDHFRDRAPIDLGHALTREVLDIQPYEKWKALRSLWTPLFSVGRIRAMSAQIGQIVGQHVDGLLQEAAAGAAGAAQPHAMQVNARTVFTRILVDVLTTCMHGVKFHSHNDQIIEIMKSVLCEGVRFHWTYNLTFVLPLLKRLLSPFRTNGIDSFHKLMKSLMSNRVQSHVGQDFQPRSRADYNYTDMLLQIQSKLDPSDRNEFTATAQALELYFGVYDSTGTVLALLIYYLAMNPAVQDRVIEEIDAISAESDGDDPTSEIQLPYLIACLNETMRLSPPFLRVERACTRDWEHGGLRIPKGMRVLIPLYALHRHPVSFPNPDEFDPLRFLPSASENHGASNRSPYTFSAFGHGPKNCIGMKFAYETMKLVLCKFFKEFTVQAVEGITKLEFKPGTLLAAQYEPIIVNLILREVC